MLVPLADMAAQPAASVKAPFADAWRLPLAGAPLVHLAHEEVFSKLDVPYLRVGFFADGAGLAGRPKGTRVRSWILTGQVWCARRSIVLQGIGGELRREGLEAQLKAHWPEGAAYDARRPAVKALLEASTTPLARRDVLEYVWQPGGRTHVRHNGGDWLTLRDRVLQKALLRIAFGNETDPGTPALDRALEAFADRGR